MSQLREDQVVCDELGQFGEVPAEPLADPHRKGIDILVKELQQAD